MSEGRVREREGVGEVAHRHCRLRYGGKARANSRVDRRSTRRPRVAPLWQPDSARRRPATKSLRNTLTEKCPALPNWIFRMIVHCRRLIIGQIVMENSGMQCALAAKVSPAPTRSADVEDVLIGRRCNWRLSESMVQGLGIALPASGS